MHFLGGHEGPHFVHDSFLSRGQSWPPPPLPQFGTSEGRRRQAEAPRLKRERLSDTIWGVSRPFQFGLGEGRLSGVLGGLALGHASGNRLSDMI